MKEFKWLLPVVLIGGHLQGQYSSMYQVPFSAMSRSLPLDLLAEFDAAVDNSQVAFEWPPTVK
jgi:hypothetical protein